MDNIIALLGCLFDMNFTCLQICKNEYILVLSKALMSFSFMFTSWQSFLPILVCNTSPKYPNKIQKYVEAY